MDSEFDRVKDQYVELQEVFKNFAAKGRVASIQQQAQKMEKSLKCKKKQLYDSFKLI